MNPADNIADEITQDVSVADQEELAIWGPWLRSTGVSDNAGQLLQALGSVDHHGLSPHAYGLDLLKQDIAEREAAATLATFEAAGNRAMRLADHSDDSLPEDAELRKVNLESTEDTGRDEQRLERLLQMAFVRLAKDLGRGRVDPRKSQTCMFLDAPEVDTDQLLADIDAGRLDVRTALQFVMPRHEEYKRLVAAMEKLLDERARKSLRTHVPEVGSLRVGHHHGDIMEIKRRLIEMGDINPDTIITPMFDAPLKLAVMQSQDRHGIPDSGIVDPRTRAWMNTDINEAIAEVALTLERWRWMLRDLGDRYLFMNLPSFRLSMMNEGEQIIDMAVVIGSAARTSPTFSRDMTYIEVNPTWTVPHSIAHRALLPRELENPGYLRDRDFEFLRYRDGKPYPIPYESVTADDLKKRPFPYLLRQAAGDHNALGRVKFMMPNQYRIYFHDTLARGAFALPEQAYSKRLYPAQRSRILYHACA